MRNWANLTVGRSSRVQKFLFSHKPKCKVLWVLQQKKSNNGMNHSHVHNKSTLSTAKKLEGKVFIEHHFTSLYKVIAQHILHRTLWVCSGVCLLGGRTAELQCEGPEAQLIRWHQQLWTSCLRKDSGSLSCRPHRFAGKALVKSLFIIASLARNHFGYGLKKGTKKELRSLNKYVEIGEEWACGRGEFFERRELVIYTYLSGGAATVTISQHRDWLALLPP